MISMPSQKQVLNSSFVNQGYENQKVTLNWIKVSRYFATDQIRIAVHNQIQEVKQTEIAFWTVAPKDCRKFNAWNMM